MGQGLLRSHEERSQRRAPRGGSFVGVQMDSHHLSMLERRQTVRRGSLYGDAAPAWISPGRSSGISHQYRVEDHRRISETFLKKTLDGITQKDSEWPNQSDCPESKARPH